MAARENQGLQIALIIFVILTILLIVSTFLFFRSYSEERDRGKQLASDAKAARERQGVSDRQAAEFRGLITSAESATPEAVQEAFDKAITAHGEGLPAGKQNYEGLLEHLVAKLRKYETANTDLATQVKELDAKLQTNDQAAQAEVAKFSAELDQAKTDLEEVRKTFVADRGKITGEKEQLAARFEAISQEHGKLSQKADQRISDLTGQLSRTEQLLTDLRNKEDLEKKANEFPDGRITFVDQRAGTVWLNVGRADGLREQTSFVIVAPEDGNPIKSTPKGKIDVVRLTGPHQAEARIVEDDLSDPIMPGDHIFSVVWEAGRPERFALAGNIDIDEDGESDRQRVRDLIAVNGGILDAEVARDGTTTGQMSINTKYLVRGERPNTDDEDLQGYSDILKEAQKLGVEVITVREFLDYLGYQEEHRTVNLGRHAKPIDFKPRLPEGRQRIVPGTRLQQGVRKSRTTERSAP